MGQNIFLEEFIPVDVRMAGRDPIKPILALKTRFLNLLRSSTRNQSAHPQRPVIEFFEFFS